MRWELRHLHEGARRRRGPTQSRIVSPGWPADGPPACGRGSPLWVIVGRPRSGYHTAALPIVPHLLEPARKTTARHFGFWET